MSELETFRDHCRAMANWQPPEPRQQGTVHGAWCRDLREQWPATNTVEAAPQHGRCDWDRCPCECHPTPDPPTGPTSNERVLWARLAAEVDAYLGTDADEGLFA